MAPHRPCRLWLSPDADSDGSPDDPGPSPGLASGLTYLYTLLAWAGQVRRGGGALCPLKGKSEATNVRSTRQVRHGTRWPSLPPPRLLQTLLAASVPFELPPMGHLDDPAVAPARTTGEKRGGVRPRDKGAHVQTGGYA